MSEGPVQDLPESSRNTLVRMAEAMRSGYTGTFVIRCRKGGVREFRSEEVLLGPDLRDGADDAMD